jgi:dTDP-4-amino-4,6-dideoxygalactose transaminase
VNPIPLLDLEALHREIRDELVQTLIRVADSGRYVLGEEVSQLEEAIAGYCGARFAVGCASGSDALYLALRALGIGPGDSVVTTPFTFFATAGAVSRAGATPVFADIDPRTFNLDPESLAEVLRRKPGARAVIAVHLFGGSADMAPILREARRHGCAVIEDGAQAIGAEYAGRRVNALADAGCLSFFPSKNLGALGDAGMVLTGDAALAETVATLRVHGSKDKYRHEAIGVNSRLDALQAAVLRTKLKHLDDWTARRQKNARLYGEILGGEAAPVVLPQPAPYQTRHVFNQFVIRCPRRDELKSFLAGHGVGTEVYYPIPLHLQPCYRHLGYEPGAFPESERAAAEVLALPVHPALPEGAVERVAELIRAFYSRR